MLNPKLKAQDISCEDDIVLKMELCADCILKEVNKGHKKTERTEKAADNYEEIE